MMLPPSTVLALRHLRLRNALDGLSLDALVITGAVNIRYLTNHVGSAGVLVATREAMHIALDFRYRESVRLLQESSSACPGLRVWDVPASYAEALLQCLAQIASRSSARGRAPHGRASQLVARRAHRARDGRGTAATDGSSSTCAL